MSDDVKKEELRRLEFLCGKLLRCYPLFDYRVAEGEGWTLSIALAGSGEQVRRILRQIFPMGQLLKTALEVTILSSAAQTDMTQLQKAVPELCRFIRIRGGDQVSYVDWPLGTLCVRQADWRSVTDWTPYQYVLICEDVKDKRDLQRLPAGDASRLVAHIRDKDLMVVSPAQARLSGKPDDADKKEEARMKEVGYHLHYVYQKFTDPRATREEIEKDFEDAYNRDATLGNVRHIRSKMACCGVEKPDLTPEAAAEFARKLHENEGMLAQLADLEHKRWLMDKVFHGYRLQEDVQRIYQNEGDNTHSPRDDSQGKTGWHVCLVPSAPDHRLTFDDWQTDETNCRGELDPLDRISLQVHRVCREIAYQRKESILQDLPRLEELVNGGVKGEQHEKAVQYAADMHSAVLQMYQKKRIAYSRYQKNKRDLKTLLEKQKDRTYEIGEILSRIDNIDKKLLPLKEYIFNKDHKGQDYLFVEHIPYALTCKKNMVLAKFLGEKADEQFVPWQMEPAEVIYVGFADTAEDAEEIAAQAERTEQFLSHSCNEIRSVCHLFARENILDADELQALEKKKITVHQVSNRAPEVIVRELTGILEAGSKVDYIDVTGGSPVLIGAAFDYVRSGRKETGLLYARDGYVRSILGAEVMEYAAPRKGVSVLEMFEQAGAVLIRSESSRVADLSNIYRALWEDSCCADTWKNASGIDRWQAFCKFMMDAYSGQKAKRTDTLTKLVLNHPLEERTMNISVEHLVKLRHVIQELETKAYLEQVSFKHRVGNLWQVSFKVHGAKAADKMVKTLSELTERMNDATNSLCSYEVKENSEGRIQICSKELKIKNAQIPPEHQTAFVDLLQKLEEHGIIYELKKKDLPGKCTMRIPTVEVLTALTNPGKVLEYYLYNSALQEGMFDDVDLSWEFFHNAEAGAAQNELDVICTKGNASLFISAKNVGWQTIKKSDFRNSACYEVSVLADRFGLNARKVLAAPSVPQFENGKRSDIVRHAMGRGVYLLGRECFKPGKIGKVLDNIVRGEEDWCEFLMGDSETARK